MSYYRNEVKLFEIYMKQKIRNYRYDKYKRGRRIYLIGLNEIIIVL